MTLKASRQKLIKLLAFLAFTFLLANLAYYIHSGATTPSTTDAGKSVNEFSRWRNNNNNNNKNNNIASHHHSSNNNHLSMEVDSPPPKIILEVDLPKAARLGNLMFSYSSLVGLALKFKATVHLDDDQNGLLSRLFHMNPAVELGREAMKSLECPRTLAFREGQPSAYDSSLEGKLRFVAAGGAACTRVHLGPYLQSWRYFREYETSVRSSLRFKDWIVERVRRLKRKILSGLICSNSSSVMEKCLPPPPPPPSSSSSSPPPSKILWIGIHVRRTDMTWGQSMVSGYLPATADYLNRAIGYAESKFNASALVFLVASDDVAWCRSNLRSKSHVVYAEDVRDWTGGESEEEGQNRKTYGSILFESLTDLSLLASCQHVIMTVGSFGWWAGYLAGGTVVYFKDYPKPGTLIAAGFSARDHYPSHWIGMR